MNILKPYQRISDEISQLNKNVTLIVVTKTFSIDHVKPLVKYGHIHFGENKVQEALNKWTQTLLLNSNLRLHMIGNLQSNKAEDAVSIFSYIHSLDSEKLALKLNKAEQKYKRSLKYFIQVNVGNENQKSGIGISDLSDFLNLCLKKYNLNIIGLMCLPPMNEDPKKYFFKLKELADQHNLYQLSMGMSNDYKLAIDSGSTFVRIGSQICGSRS
jgi:pyridoxal phosphate enzyme (YggS family)